MSTKYIASNWRLPNEENSNKSDNYGLSFDGNESIGIESSTELDNIPSNPYSFSFWFKSSTAGRVLSEKRATNTFIDAQYTIHLELGYVKWYGGADGSTSGTQTSTTLIDDEWHHIVCVAESTTVNKIYVDGQLDVTSTANRINSAVVAGTFRIGSNYGQSYRFIGQISSYCIFDYALNSTQVSTLYGSSSLGAGNPMALKPQPVAYYPLGDNSASNPLTQPNEAVEDASVFDFDNTANSHIKLGSSLGNYLGDSYSGDLTLSLWFNADTSIQNKGLFQIGTTTSQGVFSVRGVSGTAISFGLNQIGYTSKFNFSDLNSWHHLVCIYKGGAGGSTKMYLDGVQQSTTDSGTFPTSLDFDTEEAYIGLIYNLTGYDWDGKISNVVLWNSDQTTEISNIYNSGVPATSYTNTPTAWYKLDQSSNWEADSSGAWQIPDAVSAYPQSFDFDGTSQGVILPNDTLSSITGDFAFSFWFNQSGNGSGSFGEGYLLGAYTDGGGAYNYLHIYSRSNDIWVNIKTSGGTFAYIRSGSTQFTNNTWNNVIVQRSGNDIEIYINGNTTPIKTQTISGDLRTDWAYSRLGQYLTNGYFNGNISNSQFWNTSLSTSQVETLYNNGVPLTTAIASDNLKAWYKLDNTELFDGNNWSVENQKYPANWESALSFDGINDEIECGSISQTNEGDISFSAWCNVTASGTYQSILSSTDTSSKAGINIIIRNDGLIKFERNQDTSNTRNNTGYTVSGFSFGSWNHLCGTFNSTSGELKAYVNGALQATSSNTSASASATNNFHIGILADSTNYPANGMISNIAIFNTTLDSTAIQALYNNGTPETSISSSPVSWWKLDNTTTGIQDSVGSNDGTNNGATKVNTFVSTEAATSSGMTEQNLVNNNVSVLNGESSGMTSASLVLSDLTRAVPYDSYSFNFDSASSDVINITNNSIFNLGTSFTISGWFNFSSNKYQGLISFDSSSTRGWFLFQLNDNSIKLFDGTTAFTLKTSYTTTDQWDSFILTYDGTDLVFYINGVQESTQAVSIDLQTNGNDGQIGNNQFTTGRFLNGKASNISIFNEALTSTEVLKLYSNGVPQDLANFTPAPVAWYPLGSNSFWNGSQWTVRDMIGSNDGTGQNIGIDGLVGDSPRSSANGVGTNNSIPENLVGTTKWSELNSWSINMSSEARTTDVP